MPLEAFAKGSSTTCPLLGVTGCDDSGPLLDTLFLPSVSCAGGDTADSGGGVSSFGGGGIFVPSVSDSLTGSNDRNGRLEVLERCTWTVGGEVGRAVEAMVSEEEEAWRNGGE